jgi:uncharacterized protein YoxC
MDPLIALLIVVVSILSVLLVIVGVQVILILKQFRQTLDLVNKNLHNVEDTLSLLAKPFTGMGDTLAGLKSGLKLSETFILWLKQHHHEKDF